VSKLLLAVQECCLKAIEEDADPVVTGKLLDHYYEIEAGIGVHKSPELYGAFPTDPYSHTPQHRGAQQPGNDRPGEGRYFGAFRRNRGVCKRRSFVFQTITAQERRVFI